MRELAELAAERGVWLISDEVYDELVLDDELRHVSAAALVPDAPVVSVYSFSKVYAMTGWRIGYCAAPPQLAAMLRKLQEPQVSCPSAISQKAAEAALRGPHDEIVAMRLAYRRLRGADGMNPVFAAEADGTVLGFLDERRGELIDFARTLVATPSPNPPGDERAVAALVVDKLRALGIGRIDTVGASEARPNVIARVGSTARPALVLCGHLDTNPPGDLSRWRLDPYGATSEDG